MQTSNKDRHILTHIIEYCDRTKEALFKIGSINNLFSSAFNQDALSMPLLQIGELVRNMTDETKERYSHIPWIEIRALRNVLVHSYGEIDWEKIWDTAVNDIPKLKEECLEIQKDLEPKQSKGFSR